MPSIPNEAIEAAAEAMYEFRYENKSWDEAKSPDVWRAHALVALESAEAHILKNMRPMTAIEIAARERPEQIEAARARVRAGRKEAQVEALRAAKEAAWTEGMLEQFEADLLGKAVPTNPYRAQGAGQ